ncbi:ferrous iron transport protein B [soil metagenome]
MVALVGNPNAGKTTLFNSLTGSHQKVGNYPGVTVEKISANLKLTSVQIECIDVPGLYSLNAVSEDERVALMVIEGSGEGMRRPDLLIAVIDATNLERNLYLYSQLAEIGIPIVVALTMVDRLDTKSQTLDLEELSRYLDAPVVPLVGHKERGIDDLKLAIERNLIDGVRPDIQQPGEDVLADTIAEVRDRMARIGVDYSASQIRRALVKPDENFDLAFEAYPEVREILSEAREQIGTGTRQHEVTSRYAWAAAVQRGVLKVGGSNRRVKTLTDKIDRILTDRFFGLLVFIGTMYLVFLSIYTFAQPLMGFIDKFFQGVQARVSPALESIPWLQSLIVDGLIGGIGSALVFLPQILILFFFIAVLEGSGYLARAAFLMDRLLGWCGLNGRAFIPLLSSFACAIPGIMAARVMPDRNSRLATILVAPLMSCSARLPVYILLIGAFIEPRYGAGWAAFSLFAMHLLGLVVAVPIVWVLNRKIIRGKRLPFLLELPAYQWPRWKDVWLSMYFRGKVFVQTAGTIIFLMSVIIWGLGYFPRLGAEREASIKQTYLTKNAQATDSEMDHKVAEEQLANSVLGRFGRTIEPVFIPAGFDWRITTSILSAFPARETVVPSLKIIFALGKDDENETLTKSLEKATWPDGRKLFTLWNSIGLMVFFALCAQCMATLATVKRETNSWKWPVFMFTYMTALAYIAAVLVNVLGNLVS